MKIIIAGAGIGGLTAAIALAREGHEVVVCERASALEPVGAGIGLQPNAMQALACLDLDARVSTLGSTSERATIRNVEARLHSEFDCRGFLESYGFLPRTVQRASLLELLVDEASARGVTILLGHALRKFDATAREVHVDTDDGPRLSGEILVGADGIHSRVREQLWGGVEARHAGYACWRGVVDTPACVAGLENMHEYWGVGARFGFMPCGPGKVYWFATSSSVASAPAGDLPAIFADWPDPIPELIAATPERDRTFGEIGDRPPRYPWGQGRVTLLGDAAHPMTPNFGQGGAQALEDAVVLARALAGGTGGTAELRAYERHRQPRTRSLVLASRKFGELAQGQGAWTRFIRDRILPRLPSSMSERTLDRQLDFRRHLAEWSP